MQNNFVFLLLTYLMVSGCAMQDYRRAAPDLHLVTKERLSVGVQDHRPYIINHDKEEYFVGIQRGGFGIPVSLPTESTRPLAEDMTDVLVKALANAETTVVPMKITPVMKKDAILHIAQSQQAKKIILLTLLNWKTDTYQSTDLTYDISITIFDSQGHELATKQLQGTDNLGKSILNPQSVAVEFAPIAFEKKLEELFSRNIVEVLSNPEYSTLKTQTSNSAMTEPNMDCQTDIDCAEGYSCRSKTGGGTECRVKDISNTQQPSAEQAKSVEQSSQATPSLVVETSEQPIQSNPPSDEYDEVKYTKRGGIYLIPVLINEVLQIKFVIDTGASDVNISPDVYLTLLKTGTIQKRDRLPGGHYQLANGSIVKSDRFIIRTLKIGNRVLKNVACSISDSIDADMLLGQSALEQLGNFTFHYDTGTVRFNK